MKTALTALAMMASATVALAEDGYTVVGTGSVGDGHYEIVTRSDGDYSLWRASCVPMKLVLVDTDDDRGDLNWNKWQNNEVQLEDVVRGTTEHEIASAACS